MKILTKKKQDKIISLLCENAVIFHRNIIEDSDVEPFIDNKVEICDCIGGFNGAIKFLQFMERFIEKELEKNEE